MSRYGQRWRIALVLLTLFALVACGPHVPDLRAGSTPVGTAGGNGGGGTGTTGSGGTTGTNTEPGSSTGSESPSQSTESTDTTETASPTETGTEPASPSVTDTGTPTETRTSTASTTPPEISTINCTSDVPASAAAQATEETSPLPPNDVSSEKPDLSLAAPEKCAVGLGNPPETTACLFVWVELRVQGQGIPTIQVGIHSESLAEDGGLHEEKTAEAGPEIKPAEVHANIRITDLGRTHEVTFIADPQNAIEETVEDNNSVTVKLSLPGGTLPASAVCPPETTATPQAGGSTTPAPATETAAGS